MRNAGTWAGNLGVFLRHQDFPSDAVLALIMAKAQLTLCDLNGTLTVLSMDRFLQIRSDELVMNSRLMHRSLLMI